MIIVLQTDSAEFGLTIAAIPVVLVLLIACGIAVQREIKWYGFPFSPRGPRSDQSVRLMLLSLVLMLAAESYFSEHASETQHSCSAESMFP